MFAGKARGHPGVMQLKGALALFANIKLGWKGLSWTNTQAYYEHSSNICM